MMKNRFLSVTVALALVLLGFTGCGQAEQAQVSNTQDTATQTSAETTGHTATEVNIGYVDITGGGLLSDLLGVARDQGFLDEELGKIGVKANLIPMTGAGPAINEALSSGDLDIGVLGDVPAVLGKAAGIDTQVIASSGLNSAASLVAGPDTNYTSISDLKGKKISTLRGAFMHRVLGNMLEAENMTTDDIEFVNANEQGAAELLLAGNVDAAVISRGVILTRLIDQGYKVVIDYKNHPEMRSGGYSIARTKFINENPDIIAAYVRALVRAQKLAKTDKDTLLKQWESTGESAESYEYLFPDHDNYYSIEPSEDDIENGKNVLKFLLDNELIQPEAEFDFESWINKTFYEEAYNELGKE